MSPKISIIIPIFNVQDYLERCLDSILNQIFQDFEVILINDGSTDKSGEICDRYADLDQRIKVIHKKNEGVSAARNEGLNIACGRYIGFVDPDDYLDEKMYQTLTYLLESECADLAICSFLFVRDGKITPHDQGEEIAVFSRDQAIQNYFIEKLPFDYSFLWNKLFAREIIEDIRLNSSLHVQEDSEFFLRLLDRCSKIVYQSTPFYYYDIRSDSASCSTLNLKRVSVVDALYEIYKFTSSKFPKYRNIAFSKYLLYSFNIKREIIEEEAKFREQYFLLRKQLRKDYLTIIINRHISFTYKFHSSFYIFFPYLYKLYMKKRIEAIKTDRT